MSRLWEPVIVPPAKTIVEAARVERAGGVRPVVGGPDGAGQGERARGLLMTTRGRLPLAVVVAPGEGLGAGAVDEQRGRPAAVARGLADVALGGQGAGPVEAAGGQGERPADGQRGAGGDRVVVARKSTALRVWLPVIVPPAKTSVEVPGSSVPAVYVQLFAVRIVPARVSVPDGLLMTTSGQAAGGGRRGAGEGLGAGAVDEQGGRPAGERRGLADRPLGGQRAGPVEAAGGEGRRCPSTVSVVPAAIEVVARKSTVSRLWQPRDRAAREDHRRGARVERAGGVRPVVGGPDRAGQDERARRLVDDDEGQAAGGRRRGAGEGLGAGAVDEQGGRPAAVGRGLADVALGGQGARSR